MSPAKAEAFNRLASTLFEPGFPVHHESRIESGVILVLHVDLRIELRLGFELGLSS